MYSNYQGFDYSGPAGPADPGSQGSPASSSAGVVVAVIIVVVIILIASGIGVYFAFFRKDEQPKTTPEENCATIGQGYDAVTGQCVPLTNEPSDFMTEEACVNAGFIWDAQAFECVSDATAQIRCEDSAGNWHAPSRTCLYCTSGQVYMPEDGMCKATTPSTDPAQECISSGNEWIAEEERCVMNIDLQQICLDQGLVVNPDGTYPNHCMTCEEKYPGTVFDPDLQVCAPPVTPGTSTFETTWSHDPEWFSGAKSSTNDGKDTKAMYRVRDNASLLEVSFSADAKDQGWGNLCGYVGVEVIRDGARVLAFAKRVTHEWVQESQTWTIDNNTNLPFQLMPGDQLVAYIQGIWGSCSAYTRNLKWNFVTSSVGTSSVLEPM